MLVMLGCVAAAAAVWFVGLQVFVIRRMCPYCNAMHAIGLVLAILIFREAPAHDITRLGVLVTPGIVGLIVLIGGQILITPRQFMVEEPVARTPDPVEAPVAVLSPPAAPRVAVVASDPAPQAPKRIITVAKGKVTLAVDDWPIFGSPQSPHIIVSLYDYTCPDCRHVHGLLKQAVAHLGGQLAVVLVPAPLEMACNRLVRQRDPKHNNACFYTRLALAMWKLDPARFAELDAWLFGPQMPAGVAAARGFAERLVGRAELEAAMAHEGMGRRIGEGVEMLAAVGGGKLPKVLLPEAVVWGRVPGVKELVEVVEKQVGRDDGCPMRGP